VLLQQSPPALGVERQDAGELLHLLLHETGTRDHVGGLRPRTHLRKPPLEFIQVRLLLRDERRGRASRGRVALRDRREQIVEPTLGRTHGLLQGVRLRVVLGGRIPKACGDARGHAADEVLPLKLVLERTETERSIFALDTVILFAQNSGPFRLAAHL
jgi:hypothetical protein